MNILKKGNWWVWLILTIFTFNFSSLILATQLKTFKKDAWYANVKYWVLGFLFFVIPGIVMLIILNIQMTCENAKKLGVKGEDIYFSPFTWILCLIIPVIGWICLIVMIVYMIMWTITMLHNGEAEKYL